ncbi:MAG: SRPBCC family protein [Massilia sp.]
MQLNRVMTVAALAVGGVMLSKQFKKNRGAEGSSSIQESIEVNVPVRTAYNQWTQFEEFPRFMQSVHEIRQLDDRHLHWKANVAGEEKEWDAEIVEQIPDKRIAWRSISGVRNGGVVTFHKIADDVTRIMLQMDYEPENMAERIGDALGAVRMEARSNLKNFKEMVEQRGKETGAWRGAIVQH